MDEVRTVAVTAVADRDKEVEMICRWAAARAGVLVMAPKLSTTALIANDVYMVSRIASVYGHTLTSGAIVGFLGGLGGTVVSALVTSFFPQPAVKIPLAVALTYAVGKAAELWIRDGMPMPGGTGCYQERMIQVFDHIKTTAVALVSNPDRNTPLGDESEDFLRATGTKVEDFMGVAKDSFGALLGGNVLQTVGSVKGLVVGLAGAAVSGLLGKVFSGNGDFLDDTKHALSGMGALLKTVTETAFDLAASAGSSAVDSVGSVKASVSSTIDSVSDKVSSVGDSVGGKVSSVGDTVKSVGDTVKSVGDTVKSVGDTVKSVGDTVKSTFSK